MRGNQSILKRLLLAAAVLLPGVALAQSPHNVGPLEAQQNLGDLDNAATARTNLGLAPSATTDTTNAANITSGTLPAARLPTPSPSALGGVESLAPAAHQFLNGISTGGVPGAAQPHCADLSDATAACSTAIGTSGTTLPVLSGTNAWSGANSFTALSASISFLVPGLASPPLTAGSVAYNTVTGRYDFGLGASIVNHVRLSGDTMAGPLHMAGYTIDGLAVAFSGGSLSGTYSGSPTFSGTVTFSGGGIAFTGVGPGSASQNWVNPLSNGQFAMNAVTAFGFYVGNIQEGSLSATGTLAVAGGLNGASLLVSGSGSIGTSLSVGTGGINTTGSIGGTGITATVDMIDEGPLTMTAREPFLNWYPLDQFGAWQTAIDQSALYPFSDLVIADKSTNNPIIGAPGATVYDSIYGNHNQDGMVTGSGSIIVSGTGYVTGDIVQAVTVNASNTNASIATSAGVNTLTWPTASATGTLAKGDLVSGAGISPPRLVLSGAAPTWVVSGAPLTVSSGEAMTADSCAVPPQLQVTASGGVPSTFVLYKNGGRCMLDPTGTLATNAVTGSGSGLTVSLSFVSNIPTWGFGGAQDSAISAGVTPFMLNVFPTGSSFPYMGGFASWVTNGQTADPFDIMNWTTKAKLAGFDVSGNLTAASITASSTLNVVGAIETNGTPGVPSKSCVAAAATLTISNGLITATSGC